MSFSCKLFILLGCISSVINATTTTTTAGGSTTTTTAGGASTTTTAGGATTTTSGGATTTTASGICADSSTNGCTDNAKCFTWVRNGFCSNSFYTTAQKRQYCPNSCCLCASG
uniref:ShKT domain-containing protein n=1 Tax=Acrobeloides nanus TaxID=290746 RepID=A0A914E9N9_9BILA